MPQAKQNKYITNADEAYNSVTEFFDKPEFWRVVLSSSPKYFLHFYENGKHYFGLSKFCVFKNITVEDYIAGLRDSTDGGIAKSVLSNRLNEKWVPINQVSPKTKQAFEKWIWKFFPNYNVNNASFITIYNQNKIKRKRNITPEKLEEALAHQKKIGEIGEIIAYTYELERLVSAGIKNANKCLHHESKFNASSGYDLLSITKYETRYIEVKSSVLKNSDFFLSQNEVITLEALGKEAFLYIVHITDLSKGNGVVTKIICNPIEIFRKSDTLIPVAYKVNV
jgi:hypothetical protein